MPLLLRSKRNPLRWAFVWAIDGDGNLYTLKGYRFFLLS